MSDRYIHIPLFIVRGMWLVWCKTLLAFQFTAFHRLLQRFYV